MSHDRDVLYGLHVMNHDFTKVRLSTNDEERKEMIEWIERNCVGEYVIFEEFYRAFLKDPRDRSWFELTYG